MSRKIIGITVGSTLPKPNLMQDDPKRGDFVHGKEKIPDKVSQLENDSGYLTEHQDISGKVDKDDLPEAIDQAWEDKKVASRPRSCTFVKSGSTVTLTTPLSDGSTSTSIISLDVNNYPTKVVTDGVECPITWEGFDNV